MDGWVVWAIGGGVVAVLVLLDRLTAAGAFDRRRRPEHPERRPGGAPLGSAMGALLDFYDPSHRHVTEEQQREKSMTVQKQGEGPPRDVVDLDAGVAEIRERRHAPASDAPHAPEAPDAPDAPGAGSAQARSDEG